MHSYSHTVTSGEPRLEPRVAGWCEALERIREAGFLRDLDVVATATAMDGPASADAVAALMRAYYRDPDPIERAWRVQGERWLELPSADLPPEALARVVPPLVPEERLELIQHPDCLELCLGPARLRLRRIARHARSGVVRASAASSVNPQSLVYGLNALLSVRRHARRFVPVRGTARHLVWASCTEDRAEILASLGLLAESDPRKWRKFAGFDQETRLLAS